MYSHYEIIRDVIQRIICRIEINRNCEDTQTRIRIRYYTILIECRTSIVYQTDSIRYYISHLFAHSSLRSVVRDGCVCHCVREARKNPLYRFLDAWSGHCGSRADLLCKRRRTAVLLKLQGNAGVRTNLLVLVKEQFRERTVLANCYRN